MPQISVIIPNYNTAPELFLPLLRSVFDQTYTDFEVVLVDDGSTEEYRSVYQEVRGMDERLRVIFTENGGVSHARNLGLTEVTGRYVLFVDADDLLVNTFFEEAMTVATQYDADAVLGCNIHAQDYDPAMSQKPFADSDVVTLRGDEVADLKAPLVGKRLRFENGLIYIGRGPWTRLFKREIATQVAFDRNLKVCEDIQWNLEALSHCQTVCYVKRAWYLYNMHAASATRRHNAAALSQAEDGLAVVKELLDMERDDQYKAFGDRLIEDMTRLHRNCLSGSYDNVKKDRRKVYTTAPWNTVTEPRYRKMADRGTRVKILLYRLRLLMLFFDAKAWFARRGRTMSLSVLTALMTGLFCGCGGGERVFNPWSLLFLLIGGGAAFLAAVGTRNYQKYRARKREQQARRRDIKPMHPFVYAMYAVTVVMLVLFFALLTKKAPSPTATEPLADDTAVTTTTASKKDDAAADDDSAPHKASFSPVMTASSNPETWGIDWEILQGNQTFETFTREQPIAFSGEDYFALKGIATFRGNSRRTSATYGTAAVTEKTVDPIWNVPISSLAASGGGSHWTGSGWTGQPLIVEWPEATRKMMNLYETKKTKDGLVEVIHATLDGHIYFLDLEDGSYTRDPLFVGMCFKGAGSLDPRGYPLMYVGSGDETEDGLRPRMFIINLIDCSIAYEYGHEDARLLRKDNNRWCAFDSSPLVDAETDTLIWPGESGLLYTIKLNTFYDVLAKTITINPDEPVVTRYTAARSGDEEYWYGYEASAVIEGGYLYVSENGGLFYCVDLNTMELVWVQDTKDDSNSTPVMEYISDNEAYIYTAPSLHWTADDNDEGEIAVYKLNALTGEIVWQTPFNVHTVDGVSGGVQSTPLLGKAGTALEGLIVYTVARTPDVDSGVMVALSTETGKEVWSMDMENYTWSSPVAVYGEDGAAYVVTFDADGFAFFVDGKTGELLYTSSVGSLVEASPAVYNDKIVVGTRGQQIYGLQVK